MSLNITFPCFQHYDLVAKFTDPVEALAYIQDEKIDLVITDIAMPKLSGIEMLKLVKSTTRFVISTSFSKYAVEGFELQVVDYLLKPISLRTIF